MTFSSPIEDLQRLTLRAIISGLRRLEYLAGLRDGSGRYTHWGFERVYGDIAAEKTMQKAHRSVVSEILSTPLRDLREEVQLSGEDAQIPPAVYLEQLTVRGPALLPSDPAVGSERHLNSVLHALSELERNREAPAANHQSA
jgi:hypothetical protein